MALSARSQPSCACQVLLNEEPQKQMCTEVRLLAMLAITGLRYLFVPLSVHLHKALRRCS